MKKLWLRFPDKSSEIVIGSDILSRLGGELLRKSFSSRAVIISDPIVNRLYAPIVRQSLKAAGFKTESLIIPSGERNKSLAIAEKLYHNLIKLKISRDCVMIALGGGVTGDLVGFVSSTFMRGINFVQVPTTLLAQVDAGIGGKTAVNLPQAKNIVGTFYQPSIVFIDVSTLITLPAKEIRNGLAEIIKYGVIKDARLFEYLEKQVLGLKNPKLLNPSDFKELLGVWENIVERSAGIKAKIVEADEKEIKGGRMILNFGHTIGHAIESLLEYRGVSHGEAVAIGMAAASRIAYKLKMISERSVKRLIALIEAVNLPSTISRKIEAEDILAKLILDKKVRDGKINFVLPASIGSIRVRSDVPVKILREALKETGAN
ncbi:MAG: 3-dehydroquinate synthase [Candidatus Margulisiibacteriota bacterium]